MIMMNLKTGSKTWINGSRILKMSSQKDMKEQIPIFLLFHKISPNLSEKKIKKALSRTSSC